MTNGATLPVLFYDAECPMCTRSARFIRKRDRKGTVRFESLQGAEGRALVAADPALARLDSLIWVEATSGGGEKTRVHSDAVLAIASYLGGVWRVLGVIGRAVPAPIRDSLYRWVARNRPRHEHCEI